MNHRTIAQFLFRESDKMISLLYRADFIKTQTSRIQVFAWTNSLKKVTIKGSQIKSGKVTNAFYKAGKGGKLTVMVPENKVNEYNHLFRSEGRLSDGSVIKAE